MKKQRTKKALTLHEKFETLGSAVIALTLISTFKKSPLSFELVKTLAFQLELYLQEEHIEKIFLKDLRGLSNARYSKSRIAELRKQRSISIQTEDMTFDERKDKLADAVIALALIEMFERKPLSFDLVKALNLQLQLNLSDNFLQESMKFLHLMTYFALHG